MGRNRKCTVDNAGNNNAFSNEFEPAGAGTDNDVHDNIGTSIPHDIGTSVGAAGTNASDFDNVRTAGNKNVLDAEFAADAGTDGTACGANETEHNGNHTTQV